MLPRKRRSPPFHIRPRFQLSAIIDYSKGCHDITQTRYRYPRTFIPELSVHIIIRLLESESTESYPTFLFRLDYEPDKNDTTFNFDLLHCLNLLLENTGAVDVGDPENSEEDIIPTTELRWEIFPPGTYESCERKFFGRRTPTQEEREWLFFLDCRQWADAWTPEMI